MNRLITLCTTGVFFVLTTGIGFGQNLDNKWAIGLGTHAVDHTVPRPTILTGVADFKDYSIQVPISRVWVARNLHKRINLVFDAVVGSVDNFRFGIKDEFFFDGSLGLQFRAGNDVGIFKYYDPYIVLSGGYHRYNYAGVKLGGNQFETERDFGPNYKSRAPHYETDEKNFFSVGAGMGFNIWIRENWGFNYQADYKHMPGGNKDYQDFLNHKVGLVFRFGAKDSDKDGIFDRKDDCPQIPGIEEFNGCPDSDGDKIIDSKDDCPNTAGLANLNGCPDADGDGIKDSDDSCPDEAGSVQHNGCPDTDGDGFIDKIDKCPKQIGVAPDGCPTITKAEIVEIGEIARTVYFKTGKIELTDESKEKLKRVVEIANKYDNLRFKIEGHTDSVGRASTNLKLSDNRANAVKDYLIGLGMSSNSLSAQGYGEEKPIDDNNTKDGRSNNRRVEIKLIK